MGIVLEIQVDTTCVREKRKGFSSPVGAFQWPEAVQKMDPQAGTQ